MKKVNQVVSATITTLLLCGVSAAQAWTTEDTEEYWAAKADKAMRITIAPRSMRADAEAGEEMLEEFGAKYLPNAYTLYRAKREKAKEREAVLKENFPDGRRPSSTERVFYDKVAKAVAKAVAEMDRRHDELCYYYLLHKIGVVTDAELAKIDSSPIAIMLFQEGELKDVSIYKEIKEDQRAFAEKYLPTVLADYDFLVNAFSEVKAVYADGVKMDAGNAGFVLRPIAERLDEIRQKINTLADTMRQQKAYYALEETTAEELAELDRKVGCEIKRFKEIPPLRHCVRSWLDEKWTEREWRLLVPLSTRNLARTMVRIPGRDYAICKYEVTQSLWVEVMGRNPSNARGDNLPVEHVSWEECRWFLLRLNYRPEVRESGLKYRLPTEVEWKYACCAGSSGDFCKLLDGTEITADSLESVAWLAGNSGGKSHPVGQKEPNAFGLYDMYGNVWEWCQDLYQTNSLDRVCCGGSWYTEGYDSSVPSRAGRRRRDASETTSCPSFREARDAYRRGPILGFRLAASFVEPEKLKKEPEKKPEKKLEKKPEMRRGDLKNKAKLQKTPPKPQKEAPKLKDTAKLHKVPAPSAPPPPPEVKVPDSMREFSKGTAAEDPLKNVDVKKMLEMGYRYGARNQLASSEEQLCLSLIKRAIGREWDKESFNYHEGLRNIQVKLQLDADGKVRDFTVLSGSGDADVDRTAQNALTRLRGTKINGLSEQFLKKYPELHMIMEPKMGR